MDIGHVEAMRLKVATGTLVLLAVWESLSPFLPLFAGAAKQRDRVWHGLRNLALGAVNALIVRFGFVWAWTAVTTWTVTHGVGIRAWLGGPEWGQWVLVILLLDAWTYMWHRLNHRIPILWRFHRLHHSDEHMDVTTASRFHVGEIIGSSVLRIPVLALVGASLSQLALYELLLFAVVQFHHANIALPETLDRRLRWVIVTPHLHKVHHSVDPIEQQANFGSMFTWWDRMARTLTLSPDLSRVIFGLDEAARPSPRPDAT